MMEKGVDMRSSHKDKAVELVKQGEVVGRAIQGEDGLPHITRRFQARKATALLAQKVSTQLWHQHLGHVSYDTMARMVKTQAVVGFDVDEKELRSKVSETCDVCVKAKHTEASHTPSRTRAAQPLDLIHSDLMGPLSPAPAGGNRYLPTAIDDYSGFAAIKPLKYKSKVSASLKMILLAWERQLQKKVKAMRTEGQNMQR
jgi:hypothetical protein